MSRQTWTIYLDEDGAITLPPEVITFLDLKEGGQLTLTLGDGIIYLELENSVGCEVRHQMQIESIENARPLERIDKQAKNIQFIEGV